MNPLNDLVMRPLRLTFYPPPHQETGKSGESGVAAFTTFSAFTSNESEKCHIGAGGCGHDRL